MEIYELNADNIIPRVRNYDILITLNNVFFK